MALRKTFLITLAIGLALTLALGACSAFTGEKKYALDIEVKCPCEAVPIQKIPEILLT